MDDEYPFRDYIRPRRELAYFGTAQVWSEQSTCMRAHVGAVLVSSEGWVVSTGFNGSESGQPHCTEVGCFIVEGHCARTIHAEKNALLQAAARGISTRGASCYSTMKPCFRCQMELRQAGVVKFHWLKPYRDYENNPGDLSMNNTEESDGDFFSDSVRTDHSTD